jgi:hypothetical protein
MVITVAASESSMSVASYRKYLFAYAWQGVYIKRVECVPLPFTNKRNQHDRP